MLSDVQNFYAGKTVFITGATGFVGQILLSKLLCSCQELRRIYILVRENCGEIVHLRWKEIFDDPVFMRAKKLSPDIETKVQLIRGDCCEKNLGISDSDRAIIENEVDIIFHIAATVKFAESLRVATYINVRSLDILLDIAQNMKNLKAFMHISTGYSPCAKAKCIEEKFYDPSIEPHSLISLVDHLDDTILQEMTPKLMNKYPNWYIYTKLVAEDLCRKKGSNLPLCVFRPVGVIPCSKEPLPGWINNSYGVIGIAHGHALGILRVAPASKNVAACIVPGDYCANALILSAYYTSLSNENKKWKLDAPPIINYSNCNTNFKITWGNFRNNFEKSLKKYPFYNMMSLPYTMYFENYFFYKILAFFLHLIPAAIFDLGLLVVGEKPRYKKIYGKVHQYLDLLCYFSTKEWTVITNNIDEVWATLSDKDKELFYCDLNQLNMEEYFDTLARGIRLYLAKDSEDTVQRAMKKRRKFRIAYYSSIFIILLIFLHFLKDSFGPVLSRSVIP